MNGVHVHPVKPNASERAMRLLHYPPPEVNVLVKMNRIVHVLRPLFRLNYSTIRNNCHQLYRKFVLRPKLSWRPPAEKSIINIPTVFYDADNQLRTRWYGLIQIALFSLSYQVRACQQHYNPTTAGEQQKNQAKFNNVKVVLQRLVEEILVCKHLSMQQVYSNT